MSKYKDEDWLRDKIQKGFTHKQIANMCGLKSTSSISHFVKKFQIKQPESLFKDKEWMYHHFIYLNKHTNQIAKEINVIPNTISKWTRIHMLNKQHSCRLNSYQDKRWLYKHLVELEMNYEQVAKISNVTAETILDWAKKYDIKWEYWTQELREKLDNKEWLYEEYIIKDKSSIEIAKDINVSKPTVLRRLRKFQIKKQPNSRVVETKCDNCLTNIRLNNARFERSQYHYCSVACKNEHNHIALKKGKLYHDKSWLYENLVTLNRSFKELEEEIGVSRHTLMSIASKLGVKKRELGLQGNKNQETTALLKNRQWLKHQYITLDKDIEDLSREFGFGRTTVARYLRRHSLVKKGDPRKGFHAQIIVECNSCGKGVKRKASKLNQYFTSCSKICLAKLQSKWMKESGQLEKLLEGNRKYYETPEGQEMRKLSGVLGAVAFRNKKETYIEKFVRVSLEQLNISFLPNHPIGYYVVDFYIPHNNLVIEANGDYWHWNPEVYEEKTPPEKLKKNIRRDKAKISYLSNRHYNLLTLWEKDINTRPDWCIEQIKLALNLT